MDELVLFATPSQWTGLEQEPFVSLSAKEFRFPCRLFFPVRIGDIRKAVLISVNLHRQFLQKVASKVCESFLAQSIESFSVLRGQCLFSKTLLALLEPLVDKMVIQLCSGDTSSRVVLIEIHHAG